MFKSNFTILLILFLLLVSVFYFQIYIGTTISSPQSLATELVAPKNKPQEWGVQNWIPMKYRALFRWIVLGTYKFIFPASNAIGFYRIFLFYSFIFLYCALISLFYFLIKLGFKYDLAFLGCILFLLSPPILLAYNLPVHTREDVLAYFLVIFGLNAILEGKSALMCIVSILGALTRENTLIVPLTYLLFTKYDKIQKRIIYSSLPVLAFISLRFLLGYQGYNPVYGFVVNIEHPVETLFFFLISFGALWFPAIFQWIQLKNQNTNTNAGMNIITKSFGLMLFLVVVTNLLFAMIRENRILFMLFPWIIPMVLTWVSINKNKILFYSKRPAFWLTCTSPIIVLAFVFYLFPGIKELLRAGLSVTETKLWIFLGLFNLLILSLIAFLEFLPQKENRDRREDNLA